MDPVTMMLLAQAIPAGLQLAKSYSQSKQAKELGKMERPQYEIPEAVQQQVNQARYLAGMRELPGQNVMEAKLGQNTAKGISQLQGASANSADLASNIARIYGAQNEGIQNIGLKAGQNWLGQQGQLSNALRMLGQYQQQQWDYNQKQPYEEAKAAEAALREASYRNLAAASTGIASGISGAANMRYQDDRFNKWLAAGVSNNNSNNQNNTVVNNAPSYADYLPKATQYTTVPEIKLPSRGYNFYGEQVNYAPTPGPFDYTTESEINLPTREYYSNGVVPIRNDFYGTQAMGKSWDPIRKRFNK
jgi:hypothetical protein